MGLDSVELVMALEAPLNAEIPEADAKKLLTPAAVIDYLYARLHRSDLPEDRGALSRRAFHRLRRAFVAAGVPARRVTLNARTDELSPRKLSRESIDAMVAAEGLTPKPGFRLWSLFRSPQIRELVETAVIRNYDELRLPGHGWSRQQVREFARTVVKAHLNVRRFSDHDRFVEDLGVG